MVSLYVEFCQSLDIVFERISNSLEFDAYRQAREDEKNATKRLNDMITNYYDVIPRRDFETLEAKHNVSLINSLLYFQNDSDII